MCLNQYYIIFFNKSISIMSSFINSISKNQSKDMNDNSNNSKENIIISSLSYYNVNQYDQSLGCLNELIDMNSSNVIDKDSLLQIKYNILLVEYSKLLLSSSLSSSSSTLLLTPSLKLCNMLENLLTNNGNDHNEKKSDNDDINNYNGFNKDMNKLNEILSLINPKTSTALYSLSSLYYHHHHYHQCCIILEKLFTYMTTDRFDIGIKYYYLFLLLSILL